MLESGFRLRIITVIVSYGAQRSTFMYPRTLDTVVTQIYYYDAFCAAMKCIAPSQIDAH